MVFLWIFVVGATERHMGYPVCPVKEGHRHSAAQTPAVKKKKKKHNCGHMHNRGRQISP